MWAHICPKMPLTSLHMRNTNADSALHFFHVAYQRHVREKEADGKHNIMMLFHILIFSEEQEWKKYFTIFFYISCQLCFSAKSSVIHSFHPPEQMLAHGASGLHQARGWRPERFLTESDFPLKEKTFNHFQREGKERRYWVSRDTKSSEGQV